MPILFRKRAGALAGIVASLSLVSSALADSLTDTLNKSCGAAVANLDCSDVATGWPVALGGVIGVLEVVKGKMSGAEDCKGKLSGGSSVVAQATKYLNIPGVPVGQITKCSCNIVYSTSTCSGEVEKYIGKISTIALDFFDLLGIGDYHQPPDDHDRDKALYYSANYEIHADRLATGTDDDFEAAMRPAYLKCTEDWDYVMWVGDLRAFCRGFREQLAAQVAARRKIGVTQTAAIQSDWEKKQDAATDNARKIAMNWANIKRNTYLPKCQDTKCKDDITALAFFYYGDIATSMQKLESSNTQVLSAANAKFEPLFKQKVAESLKRYQDLLQAASSKQTRLVALNAPHMRLFRTALDEASAKLRALGIRNPKRVLENAYATGYSLRNAAKASRKPDRARETDRGPAAAPALRPLPRPIWQQPSPAPLPPPTIARPVQTSTLCRFTSGPRSGETQDYAPMAPIPVGSSCQDARGSTGVVVAP